MKFDMLKIGDKVKFRGEKCVVVSFFTDEQTIFIVYKVWGSECKCWFYDCATLDGFLHGMCLEDNLSLEDRQELYKVNGLEYKRPM